MINLDLKDKEENIKLVLENDYIDRNRYLNGLINILNGLEESKIIALDGDWGSGKTFFLKSLKYLMENEITKINNIDNVLLEKLKQEYMVFYYNAWENDDASSAMLSLIYKLVNDSLKESNLEIAVDATINTMARTLNTIIKFITNGSVDIKNDVFGEQWTNKKITDEIETSEEIKETFKELITEILSGNKNKMLVIIDEIDRCKPTFAIDLLENIKHFYDDDRVVFIVGTNNKQLGASVCKVYGEKYDGYSYLDKFFDINLELPNNYLEKFISATKENQSFRNYPYNNFEEIAKYKKLTMREYNRYLKSMIFLKDYFNKETDFGDKHITMFIKHIIMPLSLCMRIKEKEKYYKLISGDLFGEIEDLIKKVELFYITGKEIVDLYDRNLFMELKKKELKSEELEERYLEIIIKINNEIYYNLTKNNNLDFLKRRKWNTMLDMISMMN